MAPSISYSRLELLGLMPAKCSLPLSTYETLKEFKICGVEPTQRGSKGGINKVANSNTKSLGCMPGPTNYSTESTTQTKHLAISLWNAQSVGNKTTDICEYVTYHDIDALCLTETWMHKTDPVVIGEFTPPGYAFINVPRDSGDDHHGGIGILYKSQLGLGLVTGLDLPTFRSFEFTIVSNMSHTLYIVLVYRPYPSAVNKLTTAMFLEEFDNFTDYINLLPGKTLLLGDFNVHCDIPDKYDVKK
jgi:hypothetical protein